MVVHCKKEPFDVYIGRPSKWGNPFKEGMDGTRSEVIDRYRRWIVEQPLMDDLHELRGKVLGCWCSPLPCHGDVLAELANRDIEEFTGEYRWLSNFYPYKITMDGEEYASVEHAFVAAKTLDPDLRKTIRAITDPGTCKKFGRTITLRPGWNDIRLSVMEELVRRKFSPDSCSFY